MFSPGHPQLNQTVVPVQDLEVLRLLPGAGRELRESVDVLVADEEVPRRLELEGPWIPVGSTGHQDGVRPGDAVVREHLVPDVRRPEGAVWIVLHLDATEAGSKSPAVAADNAGDAPPRYDGKDPHAEGDRLPMQLDHFRLRLLRQIAQAFVDLVRCACVSLPANVGGFLRVESRLERVKSSACISLECFGIYT